MMSDQRALSDNTSKKKSRRKRIWSSIRLPSRRHSGPGDMTGKDSLANGAAPAADDTSHRKGKVRRSRSVVERTSHAISSLVRGVTRKFTRPTPHGSPEGGGVRVEEALSAGSSTWVLVEPLDNRPFPALPSALSDSRTDGRLDRGLPQGAPARHARLRRRSSAPPSESFERTSLRPSYASSPAGSPKSRQRLVPEHNQHVQQGVRPVTTSKMVKKWLVKPKASPSTQSPGQLCLWSPSLDEENEWQSLSGRSVTLVDIDVCHLSVPEQKILQKVALAELNAYNLGVPLTIPKERVRGLKRTLSFRGGGHHGKLGEEKEKEQTPPPRLARGCTFGLLLAEVIRNDQLEKHCLPEPKLLGSPENVEQSLASSSESLDYSPHQSSSNLMINGCGNSAAATPGSIGGEFPPPPSHHASLRKLHQLANSEQNLYTPSSMKCVPPEVMPRCYSLSITPGGGYTLTPKPPPNISVIAPQHDRRYGSASPNTEAIDASSREDLAAIARTFSANDLLEVLALSDASAGGDSSTDRRKKRKKVQKEPDLNVTLAPPPKKVPVIVMEAIRFLRAHGLHHVGLFRVAGSKRRCRQIRNEIDAGCVIRFLPEIHSPHDVASLLKNFLRDLPEPLLTRVLYPAFTSTVKLDSKEQQLAALQLLCCMLPATHRDTLREVLGFAKEVAKHAEDRIVNGSEVPGNKMDIANMALVLGPNILRSHKGKAGSNFKVIKPQHADQQEDVSYVLTQLIEHEHMLFQVGKELHHKVMLVLLDKHPPMVDYLLKKKCIDLGLVSAIELPLVDYPAQVEGSGNLSADDIIGVDQKWERAKSNPALVRRARHYSNPVTMHDFAKKNPSTGGLVPSWAKSGSPTLNEENGECPSEGVGTTDNFREMLAMVVQELENWYCATPELAKRQVSTPSPLSPTCSPTTAIEHVLAEAVIGTWKERSPRQQRVHLRRSSSAICRMQNGNSSPLVNVTALHRNLSLGARDRHSGERRSSALEETPTLRESEPARAATPHTSGEATPTTTVTPTSPSSNRQPKLNDECTEIEQPSSSPVAPEVLVTSPLQGSLLDKSNPCPVCRGGDVKPAGRHNAPSSWPPASQDETPDPTLVVFTGPVPEYGKWQNPQLRRYTVQYLRQYFERLAHKQTERPPTLRKRAQQRKQASLNFEPAVTTSDSGCVSNTSVFSSTVDACSNSTVFSPTSPSQRSGVTVVRSDSAHQTCASDTVSSPCGGGGSEFSYPSSRSSHTSLGSSDLSAVFREETEASLQCDFQKQESNNDFVHADISLEYNHNVSTETVV